MDYSSRGTIPQAESEFFYDGSFDAPSRFRGRWLAES